MRKNKSGSLRTNLLPAGLALICTVLSSVSAYGFECPAIFCDLPYDKNTALNGQEVCYRRADRAEKLREVSWREGVKHGPARCFSNGKPAKEVTFVSGLEHGPMTEFNFDSRGHRLGFMIHGQMTGPRMIVQLTGQVKDFVGCWAQDVFIGTDPGLCADAEMFGHSRGVGPVLIKLRKEELAISSGPFQKKSGSGKIVTEFSLANGKRDGTYRSFYESGKKRIEGEYRNGRKIGIWNYFFESGVTQLTEKFNDGKLTDSSEFADNGQPRFKVGLTYKQNFLERRCETEYVEGARPRREGCFVVTPAGLKRDGQWRTWYVDGRLAQVQEFDRGSIKGTSQIFPKEMALKSIEDTFVAGIVIESREVFKDHSVLKKFNKDGSIKSEVREQLSSPLTK